MPCKWPPTTTKPTFTCRMGPAVPVSMSHTHCVPSGSRLPSYPTLGIPIVSRETLGPFDNALLSVIPARVVVLAALLHTCWSLTQATHGWEGELPPARHGARDFTYVISNVHWGSLLFPLQRQENEVQPSTHSPSGEHTAARAEPGLAPREPDPSPSLPPPSASPTKIPFLSGPQAAAN